MAIEELFVNALDDTFREWSEVGDSPFLNDLDANYIIEAATGTDKEGYFDFANSAVGAGTINSVKVSLEAKFYQYVKSFKLFVWNGSEWIDFGTITPSGADYAWEDVDVSASIDSWAKIDGCRVYVEEISVITGWVYIRRCKLKIDYSAAGGLSIPVAMHHYGHHIAKIIRG